MNEISSLPMHKKIGLVLGVVLAVSVLLLPAPAGLSEPAWRLCAVALCMAAWWSTEAIPMAITGTLPLVLFPVLGIVSAKDAATPYANNIVFLVLGGFMLALAVERWGLHRRLALMVLRRMGNSGATLVLGFMLPASLASMLISNTATTLMLVPIALAVLKILLQDAAVDKTSRRNISVALLLGISYATSMGGIATPVGTPPNAQAVAFMQQELDLSISFASWMMAAAPFSLAMVFLCWYLLTHLLYPVSFRLSAETKAALDKMYRELGPMGHEEKMSLVVFVCVAASWILRPLLNRIDALAQLSDTSIAMTGALALFALPLGQGGQRLLDWKDTTRLPWGLLLMFGGGLSLAAAMSATGLSAALGMLLHPLGSIGLLALIIGLVTLVILLTELNSNTATTAAMLPIVAALALSLELSPQLLIMPLVLAVSCAFVLPIATMPNAIVYGTGHLTIPQMVRAGLLLNLVGIVLASLFGYFFIPLLIE